MTYICECGRKLNAYNTTLIKKHKQTKIHQKWLDDTPNRLLKQEQNRLFLKQLREDKTAK